MSAVRILGSHMVNIFDFTVGWKDRGSAPKRARIVSKRPILSASCDFPGAGMDCNQATAGKRTYVWFTVFIQRQIPSNDAPHPVSQNSSVSPAPLGPIHQIARISNVRPAFGPIHLSLGMRGKYFLHPFGLPNVSMPRNRLGVFAQLLIIQFTNGPASLVIVVVNQPYLRLESGLFDCREK